MKNIAVGNNNIKSKYLGSHVFLYKKIMDFIKNNLIKIELFIVSLIILLIFSKVPYLNIVFKKNFILFVLIIFARYLFKIANRIILSLIMGMFALSLFYTLRANSESEIVGNLIYFLLWVVVISQIKKL
ncbi:hypothetical protein ACFL1A_00175 [Patescibacteria group bacterium]